MIEQWQSIRIDFVCRNGQPRTEVVWFTAGGVGDDMAEDPKYWMMED